MDLLRAAVVQVLGGLAHLGAADDGVVDHDQAPTLDQRVHRDQLHPGDEVALGLDGGHEGARPGGGVLDEWAGEGDAGGVGVADGVGGAGVGHAGDRVGLHVVPLRQHAAAGAAHGLHVHALVGGGGVAVVDPQEGADLHLILRRQHHADLLRGDEVHLARAQLLEIGVAQVQIGGGLEHRAVALLLPADHHRGAAQSVARGVEARGSQHQHGHGAVDALLGVADALRDGVLRVDQRRHQLGGVDVAAAHLQEVGGALGEGLVHQGLGVVDAADCGDGEVAQVGAHDQRLRLVIRYAADAQVALHVVDIPLELGAEGRVLDVVDGALKAALPMYHHAAAPGA